MKIDYEYKNQGLSSFPYLIGQYPPSEFDSPYRSTIPLLCFWRDPEAAHDKFSRLLNLTPSPELTLSFEYCVDAQKGDGRASQTDLMLISDQYSVAIEAKYTEGAYEKVKAWLGDSENRKLVLEGWLNLINAKTIEGKVRVDEILDLPYQMIHRLASACFLDRPNNILVYQCFDLNQGKTDYYRENLKRLVGLFHMPDRFSAFLISQSLWKSSEYDQLQNRWNEGERRMSNVLLEGMQDADFIEFGEPKVWKIC